MVSLDGRLVAEIANILSSPLYTDQEIKHFVPFLLMHLPAIAVPERIRLIVAQKLAVLGIDSETDAATTQLVLQTHYTRYPPPAGLVDRIVACLREGIVSGAKTIDGRAFEAFIGAAVIARTKRSGPTPMGTFKVRHVTGVVC